jgi:ribosome maturation factor RimP
MSTQTGTNEETPTGTPGGALSLEPFLIPLEGQAELIRSILEPVLWGQGLELVQLHLVRAQHKDTLRLFLDRAPGNGLIAVHEIESASRLVSDLLDVEDNARGLFKKPYDLEVGSPGVDRPLTKKSHFAQNVGQKARVKTRNPVTVHGQGARALAGTIHGADADTFSMDVEGESVPVAVRYDDITSAHIVFEFPSNDPRKQSKQKQKQKYKKGRS